MSVGAVAILVPDYEEAIDYFQDERQVLSLSFGESGGWA